MQANDLSRRMREICASAKVLPAITISNAEDAVPIARALAAGGLRVIEIMFRSAAAEAALRAIVEAVPDAVVGAGTLLGPEDVTTARNAGAAFAVSPGGTPALVDACRQAGLPLLPGAATATEAMALAERGWTMQKFFPAEASGGAAALAALAAPLPQIGWCPTGGVTPANAGAYRKIPTVVCVGGSWPVPADAVAARDWARIEALAREAAA